MAGEAAQTRIDVLLETGRALAQLRKLQSGLSTFHQSFIQGSTASTRAQQGQIQALQTAINRTGELVAVQKTVRSSTEAFTTALERNKLTLREYARFSAAAAMEGGAGRWMQKNLKFTQKFFAQEKDILRRAISDRVKILQSQWIRMTPIAANMGGFGLQVTSLNKPLDDLITRQQMAAQRMQLLNKLVKDGSTKLLNFGKNTQWAGRQLMVGLTIPLVMLGASAAKVFRQMEEQTVRFRRVYGNIFTSEAETQQALKNIQELAKEFTKYGIAAVETVKMAADAAAAGFAGADLEAQVKEATRLAVLGQIEQQQALETTISLQNAFGVSAEDLASKINFLNAVENQTVLSIEDITQAIPRVGPIIEQLGGNVEDLAFFLTAMKEGGVSAAQGANALKSGLASLINPTDKAQEKLQELGINLKGIVEANAGDLRGTVIGFARALQPLTDLQRSRAIEQVFGKFQFARLSALFNNITKEGTQASRVFELMGYSVEELAILSERELGKVEDAVGVKFQKTLEEIKLQLIPLGKTFLDLVSPILKFAGKIANFFTGMSDGVQKLILSIGLIAPVAIMTFGLLANFLAQGINAFRMLFAGIARARMGFKVFGGGLAYATQQEQTALSQAQALDTAQKNLSNTFSVSAGTIDRYANSLRAATAAARGLAITNPQLFISGGAAGAGRVPKKFATGTDNVRYYAKGTDTVPAMLTPGEAVIPAKSAQNPSNKPIIQAMIDGKKAQGFDKGSPRISQSDTIRQERLRAMSNNDRAILRANERKLEKMLRDEQQQKRMSDREKRLKKQQLRSHEQYIKKEDAMRRQVSKDHSEALRMNKDLENRNRREMSRLHSEALRMNQDFEKKKAAEKAKEARKEKIMRRQDRLRGASGGLAGGLFAASMVAGMAGASTGVTTGLALAGSASMLLPALANPVTAIIAAIVTVVGGLYLLNEAAKKAAAKQSKLVDAISGTTEKMKQIGILTNKIGASELMNKRRQGFVSDRYITGFERGKSQFGSQFMESEVGKEIFAGFKENMVRGATQSAEQMALQLATYISDGIMTAEQAHSIASQIGIELNNSSLTSQISGRLIDLVGPSGEDLLKDPLGVRIKIIEGTQAVAENFSESLNTAINTMSGNGNWFEGTSLTEGTIAIFTESGVEKTAAAAGATAVQNLETAFAQQDALSRQYELQIDALKKQKELASSAKERLDIEQKISDLEDKRDSDMSNIRKKTIDILNQNKKTMELATKYDFVKVAMLRGAESQVREKYKDQLPLAEAAIAQTGKVGTTELQLKLTTLMGSGVFDPGTISALLNTFDATNAESAGSLSATIDLALEKHDPNKVAELINTVGGIENKLISTNLVVEAVQGDPEQFDKINSTITLLRQMSGKEVNFQAYFESDMAIENLLSLADQLEAVEQMPTPITKEAIANINVDGNSETKDMGALLQIWDQWGNLPEETKKTVIQEYITVYNTILEGDIDAEIDRRAKGNKYVAELNKNSVVTRKNIKEELAAERTMQKVKQDIATKEAMEAQEAKKTAKARNSMFDDLLKKLKLYNKFTVNAVGGTQELMKLFGKGKNIKGFMGVQQKLRKLGAGQQLLDFVGGLGAEELEREFPKLIRITKKGKTVLSEYAKSLNQALPTAAAGDFVEKQRQIVANTDSQIKAFGILQAKGLTSAEILNILEDAAVAAGIAAGQITGENLTGLVKNTKEATKAALLLEQSLKKVRFEATEEVEGAAEKLDEKFEFSFLEIERKAKDSFQSIYKMSPEKMKIDIEISQESVEKIQKEIDTINEDISLFDRALELISRQEEDINKAYDEKIDLVNKQIDALEKIKTLNDEIAKQQKQQIDLADAITSGDISTAAKLAQEVRSTSAQSAIDRMTAGLEKRAEGLEILKQKALDSVAQKVNNRLYTRKEIEKSILELNDKIYKIENERLKPKQKEIDAQQSILDQYEKTISRAQTLLSINGFTKSEWDFIKNYVDAANKNADTLVLDIDKIAASSTSTKESWAAIVASMTQAGQLKTEALQDNKKETSNDVQTIPQKPKGVVGQEWVWENNKWVLKPLKPEITNRGTLDDHQAETVRPSSFTPSIFRDMPDPGFSSMASSAYEAAQKDIAKNTQVYEILTEKTNNTLDDILSALKEAAKGTVGGYIMGANIANQNKDISIGIETRIDGNDISDHIVYSTYNQRQKSSNKPISSGSSGGGFGGMIAMAKGGMVKPKYFANGSLARGTDTIPAMLSPGEFVVRKYAVQDFGLDNLNKINDGSYDGGAVYNYNLSVNVKSDANPNEIARTVMAQIKQVDSQRIRNQK